MTGAYFRALLLAIFLFSLPLSGQAAPFSDIFVFGDSLSDNGNLYLVLGDTTPTPISGNDFIPSLPYDRGTDLLPALSNGRTWVEQLADKLGLDLTPSLAGGNDYAFGGARMAPSGNPSTPPSVREQVGMFLNEIDITTGPDAPADALYSVWGGGNDARDAAVAVLTSGDAQAAFPFISAYVDSLAASIEALAAEGAKNILVPNIPDIGKTPAILAAGPQASSLVGTMTAGFNAEAGTMLASLQKTLNINLIDFDTFGLINYTVSHPGATGFEDISNACAVNPDCLADADATFFWDGIHPTEAGHSAIVQAVSLQPLPEPATILLLVPGLAATMLLRGRSRRKGYPAG